jgi:autotransporter-associated beta strand protein
MKIHCRKNSFLPLTAALALLVNHASAATFTWDGSDSAGWNTAGNWVGGAAPASANTTDIIISGTVNVAQMFSGGAAVISYTIKSLTFDATNDADSTFLMQGTANPNQNARNLTFASDSGNATLTVESGSTGNKTITRNTGGAGTAATIILASSLDVIHNGSGTLTLGNAVNASVTSGGGINKSGTGTLSLPGANNYSGATAVTGGTLLVNGNISTSITTVSTGGTLAGTGTVGATTIQTTGILAPGSGGIESLNTGALTLNAGSFSNFEINTAGDISDLAISSALLTFGGTLNVNNIGGILLLGDTFNLFDWNTTTGAFSTLNLPGLDPGLTWDTGSLYTAGTITVIPEPNVAALLGGLGTILLLRRRRR